MEHTLIPVGYMLKTVRHRPEWLAIASVVDICSLSGCISENLADYINYWKHNGYWLFDSPAAIEDLARSEHIDTSGKTLFYYEAYEEQYDDESKSWSKFSPEASFATNVVQPPHKQLQGYDVTTFSAGTTPECSPLSCNSLATELQVNEHCLFDTLQQAKDALEAGKFAKSEPGPCRIYAVYRLPAQ